MKGNTMKKFVVTAVVIAGGIYTSTLVARANRVAHDPKVIEAWTQAKQDVASVFHRS
jgi:hypothetical protein